ncbi:ERV/ALR sulfhydryl oxidase domain-containing protein [Catenaria anguillulae PL171]|uniref:Sulfhydryl oxidase n=1 Tax=Catenaria anguillulae PL171 TaxID=765915 RepID=A0A1Y2HVK2_9FUNG|nr:ERV/ALR sulfhydryl oxidase domain-containing protein [Catenaria anguillulae PL171]
MFLSRRTTICLLILACLVGAAFLSDLAPDPTTPAGKYRSSMSQLKPTSSSTFSSSYASSSNNNNNNGPPSDSNQPASQPARVLSWPIMPKMGNETLRAALGHSSWHLIHTMGNTYPLKPTRDEQNAMLSFIQLLGRLYPCGDCAQHFQQMLAMHPPEPHLGTRDDLAQYLCKLHNKVNLRLGHKIFDCNLVGDRWKCGKKKTESNAHGNSDQALRPDLPAAALNGKFTASGQSRPDLPKLAGDDADAANELDDDVEVDEDEQRMLAALSPLERKMRLEFRSMYPAPPREPGWVMDVHGNLVKDTSAVDGDSKVKPEEDLKEKDPRVKVVAEDASA